MIATCTKKCDVVTTHGTPDTIYWGASVTYVIDGDSVHLAEFHKEDGWDVHTKRAIIPLEVFNEHFTPKDFATHYYDNR